jgi:hypothetical protein
MTKFTNGKTPKASNQNEPDQLAIAGALPATDDFRTLAKTFAPVIELRAIKDLKLNRRNARSHSERQVQQIAASVHEFGWLAPIVIDEDDTVLAGHGRLRAAQLLQMESVPTIQVKHLTPERKRAFMLADNRLAELAEWDQELLTVELKELSSLEFDFSFEVTGFDTRDVDRLDAPVVAKPSVAEIVPELDRDQAPVSSLGDLWQLGRIFYCAATRSRKPHTPS